MEITRFSVKPRTRKHVKGRGFLPFVRNLFNKYGNWLLDTSAKIELDALKTVPKRVAHKTAEATGEFTGNKIADRIVKVKPAIDEKSKNVE